MAVNEVKQDRPGYARWVACPSAVTSGMPVLIGTKSAVALDAYDSSTGGTVFRFSGSFSLTVVGNSQRSPAGAVQINAGDEIFASGTLDATTNVTYNLTLDVTPGNIPFGNLDPMSAPILAGVTNTSAVVILKEGGSGAYAK